ncbi:hypothetical protein H0H87_010109 [Tephrocybe sp. NHM501043]|nr:hypothetical protein H0H87_010109 [Tephrocybe sp. NHM501043]
MSSISPTVPPSFQGFEPPCEGFGALDDILGPTIVRLNPSPSSPRQPSPWARTQSRQGGQPYNPVLRRKKLKEKPIYTRRQVDDMLHAVKDCFAGTMDDILKRVNTIEKAFGKPSDHPRHNDDSPDFRLRGLLDESLPRLLCGLQTLLDERAFNAQWPSVQP